MELRRDATALVVVDMQNGFCSDKGSVNQIGLPAAALQPAICLLYTSDAADD